MAIEADKVVVVLEAQTQAFNSAMKKSAATVEQTTSSIEQSANRAEKAVVESSRKSQNAVSAMVRQISASGVPLTTNNPLHSLSDVFIEIGDGAVGAQGKIAGLTTLLSLGMGAAVGGATAAIGALLQEILKTGDGVDKLVEKLKQHARETELSEQAAAIFAKTLEGEREAARKLHEELEKGAKTQEEVTDATYREAQAHLSNELALRKELAARLDLRRLELQALKDRANAPGANSDARALGVEVAQRQLDGLESKIAANDKAIKIAEDNVGKIVGQIGAIVAERATDPAKSITDQFDRLVANAKKASAEIVKTFSNLDAVARKSALAAERQRLSTELTGIENRRKAALKAAQEAERAPRAGPDGDLTRFGSPVGGGRVTGVFGENRGNRTHGGVDLAVPVGTRVGAAAGGTVIEAGTLPGYGNVVIIDHGRGTVTRYAHLSQIGVAKGQVVDAGDQIGLSGGAKGARGSGNSRGPHLHYEVRRNGRPVDPRTGLYPTDPASVRSGADAAARKAEQLAERRAAAEAQFQDKLAAYDIALADARRKQVQTAEEAAAAEEASINARAAAAAQDIEQQRDKLKRDDAANAKTYDLEAAILLAKNEQLRGLNVSNAREREQQRLEIERLKLAEDVLRDQAEVLSARADLAKTASERRDIELEILEIERQIQIAKLDELLASEELSAQERARLEQRKGQINTVYGMKEQRIRETPATPFESYQDRLNLTPKQIQERAEQAAVDELEHLRDGLVDGLTDAMGTNDPLIKQLIGLFIDQVIMKPIADALAQAAAQGGGGIGGIFSAIGSIFGLGGGGSAIGSTVAGGTGFLSGLPAFVSGGVIGQVAGRGGTDQNVLSINGQNVARVNRGETLLAVPANARASRGGAGQTKIYNISVSADNSVTPAGFAQGLASQILTEAKRMDQQMSAATLKAAPSAIARERRYGG